MIGQTISHYRVLEKIGQGGMGEVYRAEDTNLSRDVAIKVLPEQFTQDPQRLARFEREAKLLASLNHPNIAAIYGLEEADGVRFLALELVKGETLAGRIAKGPVPVEEALEVCRQIAEGVEAAHEKGVIHRDLKPANVKVTPEGKVKILDFGLAKAFEGEVPVADISQSPTLTEEMTRAGVIMGTAAYMSPEQAKGKPVDKRADVFAFGAVVYELLTGKRAFEGETITETLGAIIHKEPDWATLPEGTPSIIQVLLRQCLQKDPDSRLHAIADFRALSDTTLAPIEPISAAQPAKQGLAMTAGTVVLTAGIVGLAVWLLMQPSAPELTLNKFVITPSPDAPLQNTRGNQLAISPDGRHFVYMASSRSGNQLYLRSLDDFVDRPIPGTRGVIGSPFFSPDGDSVGFFTAGNLKKISLSGGSPVTLSDVSGAIPSGSWAFEDTIVFTARAEEGTWRLFRVPAAGGEREFLGNRNFGPEDGRYWNPQILPGAKAVLLSVSLTLSPNDFRTDILSLDTGEQKILLQNGTHARYVKTGHLIYGQPGTGSLMAVPFDLASLEATGDPVQVLEGVRGNQTSYLDYAVSDNGTLIYVPAGSSESRQNRLVWVDREGKETPVSEEMRDFGTPRISPDGNQVAVAVAEGGTQSLWIYDFESESLRRLTFGVRASVQTWSPDGKWIIFQEYDDEGQRTVSRQLADGSGPVERLTVPITGPQMPGSLTPDGNTLVFGRNPLDIWVLPMEGDSEPESLIASPNSECCPKFSPDGRWIAYVSDELGLSHVYVSPYPEPDVKWLVSGEEGGGEPVWSPDSSELFYRSGDKMMAVPVQTEPTFSPGKAEVLFEGRYIATQFGIAVQYYDISPDGQRFLMIKEEQAATGQINVVLNWFEELKRLVPTN